MTTFLTVLILVFFGRQCYGTLEYIGACTGGRCPGTLKGSIVSPKYPFPYPPKQSINYTIETNNGFQIELKFDSFRLEFGEINETSCEYDNLRIYDSDESLIERAFCGKTVRTPIRSKANKLFVIFESDTSLEDQGFAARWRKVLPRKGGLIKSPNYPEDYPDNFFETLEIIQKPKGSNLFIQFEMLDFVTESCCDGLILVEGTRSPEEILPSSFREIDDIKSRKNNRRNRRNKLERKNKRKLRGTGAMAIWDEVVDNNSKKITERDQNKEDSRSLNQIRRHPSILKVISGNGNISEESVFSYNNVSTISVLFYSDSSITRKGFNVRWSLSP